MTDKSRPLEEAALRTSEHLRRPETESLEMTRRLGWVAVSAVSSVLLFVVLGKCAYDDERYERAHPVDPEEYLSLRDRCLDRFDGSVPLSILYDCERFARLGARRP